MEPSFFQKIAEEASTPVVIADDTLKIVFFNSGMEQLTGYPAREVVGKNYPELLIPPESRGALKQAFEEALSSEGVFHTSPVITSESVIKYVEWEIMPLKAKEGTLIVKIGRELTEHMVARQRLEASKRALSSLVESIPSMVYRCYPDPNQTFIFVNRWAERLTGYTPEELMRGLKPSHIDLMHPSDVKETKEAIERAIAEGHGYQLEYRLVSRDGTIKEVLDAGIGVRDDEGSLMEISGVIMDISEYKALEAQYIYLSHMIMDSPNPVIGLDDKMRIVLWNGAAAKLLGYQEQRIRGEHVSMLFSEEEARRVQSVLDRVRELGNAEHLKARFSDAKGGESELQFSVMAIKDGGKLMGIGMVGRDLSTLKGVEHEKTELEGVLLRAAKLPTLTELASGIAQEVSTPLSTITRCAHLLMKSLSETDEQKENIEQILKETAYISRIVRGLVEFSQEQYEPFESVCLDEVVSGALKTAEQRLKGCSVHVSTSLQDDLPPVYANRGQLKQMLLKLLYTITDVLEAETSKAEKLIKITIETTKEGEYVVLHIENMAAGIPIEDIEEVLVPRLVRKIAKRSEAGHLVGYGVLINNGGYLKVEGVEGRFTRVKLMLPARAQFKIQSEG